MWAWRRLAVAKNHLDIQSHVNYSSQMVEVRQTVWFQKWFTALPDLRAKARIDMRIARLAAGNAGDVKYLAASVNCGSIAAPATDCTSCSGGGSW